MNEDKVPFIGRENELANIKQLIEAWDTQQILCIEGKKGGMGKTRLLNEIENRFSTKSKILMPKIIDFDYMAFRIPGRLSSTIAKAIGHGFEAYSEQLKKLNEMEKGDLSQELLNQQKEAVKQAFVTCFNEISAQQRIVLRFDTTDALQGKKEIWQEVVDLFPPLKNYLLVITGRNAAEPIGKFLQDKLSEKLVQLSYLKPFNDQESRQYLQEKLELWYTVMETEVAEKLLALAQGLPILIDLAVECQATNPTWLKKFTLADLQSPSAETRKEFEKQLVLPIAEGRRSIDRFMFMMSRVAPVDQEITAYLLDISPDEVQKLFIEAKKYVSIKLLPDGLFKLHDEVERMVKEYLWDMVDPEQDRWLRESRKIAQYFEKKVREIEIQDPNSEEKTDELQERRDLLTIQRLIYTSISDLNEGFDLYKEIANKARNAKRYKFIQQLQEEIGNPRRQTIRQLFITQLTPDKLYEFKLLEGRLWNDVGQVEMAVKRFQELLQENESDSERQAEIYNALGVSELQRGQLQNALDYQLESWRIINEHGMVEAISPVANQIGYLYRQLGQWEAAIQYYQQALDQATQTNLIASITNNLGYVLGMNGQYDEAISYCQEAIEMWKQQNNEFAVAQGEATLGAIYRNKGEYDKAESYLNRAIGHFERIKATEQLMRAYYDLGVLYAIKGTDLDNSKSFETALYYLQESFAMATNSYMLKEHPRILLELSYVYWRLGQKERAYQLNDEAYKQGKEVDDKHTIISSLVDRAEYDNQTGKYGNVLNYFNTLKGEYEDNGYSFPLLSGHMRRILADAYFYKGEYDSAFSYYAKGLTYIAQHGSYGRYSIGQALESLNQKLATQSAEMAREWSTQFKEKWVQLIPKEKYTILLSWCDKQFRQANLRMPKG